MDVKGISLNVGKALMINALFMFFALIISIIHGFDSGFLPLLVSFTVTFIVGFFPFIFIKNKVTDSLKDGYLIIVLAWLLSFLFGMLPYVMWGGEFTLINAWFESVSGYTTTGSTILTEIEGLPKSILFWRSSTHFIGGLGVIVFLLLIIPDSNPFKMKLSNLEISSFAKSGYNHNSSKSVRMIIKVYVGLAISEAILLWIAGMTPFDAINHSFSTVATGGFSTKNTSIVHFDSIWIESIITLYMFLASINFGVISAIVVNRSLKPLKSPVTKYYITLIFIAIFLIAAILRLQGGYDSMGQALRDSSFQTLSFVSTTGFGQADNAVWPFAVNMILIILAIHCGCSGSTTGGLKADRVFIALKSIGNEFKQRISPASVVNAKMGRNSISESTITAVFLYIIMYMCCLLVITIAVLACGVGLSDAFSATVASIGNVGPGLGPLGTMGNYASQPDSAKLIYTFAMFLGRLEIFPIVVVISMIFSRKK